MTPIAVAHQNHYKNLAWFALRTRPRWEKSVGEALEGKNFEAFLPVYMSRRRWSDRVKEVELPLFAGYLFYRMNLAQSWLPVLTIPGVRQIIGIGRTPVPVPDAEIETVRAVATAGIAAQPWPFVRVGDRVRIKGGSLDGVEGILIGTKKHHRLVVSVELLRRSVAVDLDQAWVEAVGPLLRRGAA